MNSRWSLIRTRRSTRIRSFSPQLKPTGFSRWLFSSSPLASTTASLAACGARGCVGSIATKGSRTSIDVSGLKLANGSSFRTFNVIDDFAREALAIEIDFSISRGRVVRVSNSFASGTESGLRFAATMGRNSEAKSCRSRPKPAPTHPSS